MGMEKLFGQAIAGLVANPVKLNNILDAEVSLPNIPWKPVDGGIFWNTLAEYNGWKLQQNMITKSARILDNEGWRIAWGTINGMEKALDRIVRYMEKYNENPK